MATRDDAFWADFLDIEPDAWGTPGISYRPHAGLRGYRGFWCFRRNDRVVVSAPAQWLERMRVLFSGWNQERLLDPASLANALGVDFERAIGPAFQGCLAVDRLANAAPPQVRKLLAADDAALNLFKRECGADEWETSGLAQAELWRHVYAQGERITAIAGYRSWREDAGGPCVLTHPEFRGAGHGTAVVRAVIADAWSNGKLLLYQTLESNEAAVRIALSLGYQRYGSHVAVRLKREAPDG